MRSYDLRQTKSTSESVEAPKSDVEAKKAAAAKAPGEVTMPAHNGALILLHHGVEPLEAIAVADILARSGIGYSFVSLNEKKSEPVACAHGVHLIADGTIYEVRHTDFSILVLPGGEVAAKEFASNAKVQELIETFYKAHKWVAAICAAPSALINIFPKDTKLTSYPGYAGDLSRHFDYQQGEKVVVDKKLITSRGPGTAIDFALEIVKQVKGKERSQAIAEGILYPIHA